MVSALLACFAGKAFFVKMTTAEEYQAERNRLELNRALDWSSFSAEFILAGEKLNAMTVGVWFDLLAVKSSMLYSDNPTISSIVDYVWRNSKKNTGNKLIKEWKLFWIDTKIRRCLKSKDRDLFIEALYAHLNYSLDEFPEDMSSASSRKKNAMSSVSGNASMVDEIANRYSMNPEDVLHMPLRRAFSLQRIIRTATVPDYRTLEPASLRAIKSKYLEELNNGQD